MDLFLSIISNLFLYVGAGCVVVALIALAFLMHMEIAPLFETEEPKTELDKHFDTIIKEN